MSCALPTMRFGAGEDYVFGDRLKLWRLDEGQSNNRKVFVIIYHVKLLLYILPHSSCMEPIETIDFCVAKFRSCRNWLQFGIP